MAETKVLKGQGELMFKPTPHCCDKPLGNDYPVIKCAVCRTEYNADDMLDAMMEYGAGQKPRPVRCR